LFDPVKCVENEAFVNAIRTYYFIERPEEVSGYN